MAAHRLAACAWRALRVHAADAAHRPGWLDVHPLPHQVLRPRGPRVATRMARGQAADGRRALGDGLDLRRADRRARRGGAVALVAARRRRGTHGNAVAAGRFALAAALLLSSATALAAPFAYVPNEKSGSVSVIDTATGRVTDDLRTG